MTTYTLSDGVTIEASTRSSNRSGYTGAALSPAWTMDLTKPFIAACGNPSDPTVLKELNAQLRTSLHLGSYADAREAAYTVGLYRKDPINTIRHVQKFGSISEFPSDLYDLPVGLSNTDALDILKNKPKKQPTIDRAVLAKGNLYDHFKRDDIVTIANDLGGAENFQQYITGLTIEQFATEFNLNYK